MFRSQQNVDSTKNFNLINEYIYRFNGNPNYESIFDIGGIRYRVNVLTNDSPEHGVATIEAWNFSQLRWSHVHTIPGSLMNSRTNGLSDSELSPSVFSTDFNELVTVATKVVMGY
jgi:hypothetical protein